MSRSLSPHLRNNKESGFTIIELLIATTVFATVLVLITSGIIQVTDTFFKGDTESNTQQVAATVLNTISQAIQFNGGEVKLSGNTLCVGSEEFSYWQGAQVLPANADSGVIENTTACINGTGSPSTAGRQLLAGNMRLSNLTVQCISSTSLCNSTTAGGQLYEVEVRVVYGNDDLLNSPGSTTANCNGIISGQQFCAVSDVSTIVGERI